jgi:hypothetical protein
MKDKLERKTLKENIIVLTILIIEVLALCVLFGTMTNIVLAGIGGNITVLTRLDVGNSAPEVLSVSTSYGNSLDLSPNSTKEITINAIVRDYNGETDFNNSVATFFDNTSVAYGSADDNNNHYTNSSCSIDTSYGDETEANVSCNLDIWYYANNASWNVSVYISDKAGLGVIGSIKTPVNTLLSFDVPTLIDYGTVNATLVSDEVIVNVTNFGNVISNLTLEGFALNRSDGLAMNCSLGATKNISVYYEKYNLTASNNSILSLAQFQAIYTNLTNVSVTKKYNLNFRQNDTYNEAINSTYWRIYVPVGVAGSCSGNIIFGAIRATGN